MQYVTARSLLLTLAPRPRRLAFYADPRTMAGGWVHTAPMGRGITTMNTFRTAVVGLTLLSGATLVRADVITDWTQTAIDVMKAVNVAGNPLTRTMAMMHVSMSDSINAVQDRYTRFTPDIAPDPNASAEAAAAAAAREILMRQYPGQKARIETTYAAMLEAVPDGPATAAGIALGEKVGGAVFADPHKDPTNA